MAPLPSCTPDGYKVLLYRLKDFDPNKTVFKDALRCFLAYNDVRISEDGLCPGYLVVFDMQGTTLHHLARVSMALQLVKVFMIYIQVSSFFLTSVKPLQNNFEIKSCAWRAERPNIMRLAVRSLFRYEWHCLQYFFSFTRIAVVIQSP